MHRHQCSVLAGLRFRKAVFAFVSLATKLASNTDEKYPFGLQ